MNYYTYTYYANDFIWQFPCQRHVSSNGSLCGINYITTLIMYSMNKNGNLTGTFGYLSIFLFYNSDLCIPRVIYYSYLQNKCISISTHYHVFSAMCI